ncbi:TolC family protein [Aquimarina sp. BL5]|uniref:TolC family protein n=1 Tax=Aquimarina sp. BL5 TaxID=1714860 RepID=UPI000E54AE1A|nr:TolC family protein [Aquimarina sp. BL5]AXT52524.1 TolC family protein [Aquimarina sp. BL5]RKN11289.1 TolC family protein [Aquimarina sp. BL5]
MNTRVKTKEQRVRRIDKMCSNMKVIMDWFSSFINLDLRIRKKESLLFFFLLSFLFSNGQTLQEYIKEAKENNPELKAFQNGLDASIEKVNEAGSLPNTKIGTGYFISEPETRTGAQKARFSAQQDIPWFGTIKARKETASTESDVHKNELEIAKRKITLQVEQTYYKLYELKASQNVLDEQDKLLDTYIEIALKEVENNRASTVDVLKLNIAKNNLENQKEILKGEILTTETALNQLLHRDGFDPLVVPDNLFIPEEEPTMMLNDITYHPELITYDYLNELLEKKENVNAKEALPSIGLGLDYVIVQERPNINFSDNGKDIIMPMVSLSVPLFSKKHKSRSKQYEFQKEEVFQKREASQNNLENLMEEAINNRITARINYDTQQKNIEQAKQAEKILLSQYQTAQLNFEEILDIQQMLLAFENRKIQAIANYFLQTAVLNYLR